MSSSGLRRRQSGRFLPALLGAVAAVLVTVSACGGGGTGGDAPKVTGAAALRGKELASAKGCTNCHSDNGRRSTGPTWKNVASTEVKLDGGEKVLADEKYLTASIVDPRSQVVSGYSNIMPTAYKDDLSPAQVADLVAYLQALSPDPGK